MRKLTLLKLAIGGLIDMLNVKLIACFSTKRFEYMLTIAIYSDVSLPPLIYEILPFSEFTNFAYVAIIRMHV